MPADSDLPTRFLNSDYFLEIGILVCSQHRTKPSTLSKTQDEFFQTLKQVQAELEKAIAAKAITGEKAIDAETHIKKALLQADEATPNKKTLVEHLKSAKELVTNVGGLASALTGAITAIGALF